MVIEKPLQHCIKANQLLFIFTCTAATVKTMCSQGNTCPRQAV